MPGLIGRKIGMTSVFSADGKNVPCTVIEAGPCVVTQVKTVEKDGYKAVQLGFGEAKEKNTTNAMMGCFKKAGTTPKRHLAEFKFDEEYNLGSQHRFAENRFLKNCISGCSAGYGETTAGESCDRMSSFPVKTRTAEITDAEVVCS